VAATRIADVDATDTNRFLARISGTQMMLLHPSEGIDDATWDLSGPCASRPAGGRSPAI